MNETETERDPKGEIPFSCESEECNFLIMLAFTLELKKETLFRNIEKAMESKHGGQKNLNPMSGIANNLDSQKFRGIGY